MNGRSTMRIARAIVLSAFLLAPAIEAHEVRPAFLELLQTGPETYDVLFKVPARGVTRLRLDVRFAEDSREIAQRRALVTAGAHTQRWSIEREGGFDGTTVRIDGLRGTLTDVLVRLERLDGATQVVRLMPASPSFVVEAIPSALRVAGTYLRLGAEHILLGIDHLLFVLALLLLVKGARRIVATITAFTVAHSLTLAAATLGLVHVPGPPVEAVIALSIVFVAAEIVRGRQGTPGLTEQSPWIVSFVFGLLHGFGFAGALSEIGLPRGDIPLALFTFNVGVEIGQLLFSAAVLVAGALTVRAGLTWPRWTAALPAYAIGSVAMFWVIERVTAFVF